MKGALLWFSILTLVAAFPRAVSAYPQKPPSNPGTAEASFQKGMTLFRQQRYAEAREELLRATRSNSRSAEFYFYLGMAERHLGNVAGAETSIRRSVELNPSSQNAVYNLGVLLLEENKAAEALAYLEKANRIGPPSPELSIHLIRAYLDVGKRDGALRIAESAKRPFDTPAFHLALGKCFLSHGLSGQARRALERANHLAPGQAEIVLTLVDAYLRQREPVAAKGVLSTIAGSAQNIGEYHYLLAQSHFLSGEKARALEEIRLALQLDAQNPIYLLTQGRYYQKYGDQQKAAAVLEKAARLAPDNAEVPYSLAVTYFIADDFDLASKLAERALQIAPAFDRAQFLLGISRFALGKLEEAEVCISQAIKLRPEVPYYYCFYGMVLFSQSRLAEASQNFEKALALDPSYALAHYQLGRVLVRSGNYAAARDQLEKAITLQPDLPEAHYQLGRAYIKLGEKQKAEQAVALFRKYRAVEYSERQETLRQMQEAIQRQP